MAKKNAKTISPTIKNFLHFELAEDHIVDGLDHIFFLRIHPRNMIILSRTEQIEEIKKYQSILDGVNIPFDTLAMDKAESLDAVRNYYQMCRKNQPEPWALKIFNETLQKLDIIDRDSASIQRAFYIVVRVRNRQEFELFVQQIRGKLDFSIAKSGELEVLLRNYLLHEYIPEPVYTIDRELERRKEFAAQKNTIDHISEERQEKYDTEAANEELFTAGGGNIVQGLRKEVQGSETDVRDKDKAADDAGTGSASGGLWPFG